MSKGKGGASKKVKTMAKKRSPWRECGHILVTRTGYKKSCRFFPHLHNKAFFLQAPRRRRSWALSSCPRTRSAPPARVRTASTASTLSRPSTTT